MFSSFSLNQQSFPKTSQNVDFGLPRVLKRHQVIIKDNFSVGQGTNLNSFDTFEELNLFDVELSEQT